MAVIIPFPLRTSEEDSGSSVNSLRCSGCSSVLVSDHWEIVLPAVAAATREIVTLCESCNADLLSHGVVL